MPKNAMELTELKGFLELEGRGTKIKVIKHSFEYVQFYKQTTRNNCIGRHQGKKAHLNGPANLSVFASRYFV